jgi:arylsulfatase A-like enzyme
MRIPSAVLLAALLAGCGSETDETKPASTHAGVNVLLLTIDTLRADHLSCYGYPRETSHAIDRLASRGVLFDSAYTYWPKTRGSFAALFTSLYAAQHGLTVRERDLPDYNRTLAEVLKDSGYVTAAAVDNGNLDKALGFAQGFDRYQETWLEADSERERTDMLTGFATDFLSQYDQPPPFFLWIHYVNPHTPYDPPEELVSRFRGDGIIPAGPTLDPVVGYHGGVNRHLVVPGETKLGDYVDRYDAEIAFADLHIGRVLDALEDSAHRSSTLVVLTSDHGESLGEHDYFFDHGYDLFNPSLAVPLILSFPTILPPGVRIQEAVSTLDIFPTILDIAQISFPPGLQGRSLRPLVNGSQQRLHQRLLFQNDQHQLAISNGRLKLISYPETGQTDAYYELYDSWKDPWELNNVYPRSQAAIAPIEAELERFRTATVAWQQETDRRREGAPARLDEELSDETLRNLETLGYLSKGGKGSSKKKKD